MKIKIISVAIGTLNGGVLSVIPLFLYNYLLRQNFSILNGTNTALQGALGAIFLIFLVNVVTLTMVYISLARTSNKNHVFLHVLVSWTIATLVLALTLGRNILFSEGVYGENIEAAFSVISSIINFIIIIMSTVIAKWVSKTIA